MAVFCIHKDKIDKLKGIIKGLGDKNQLDTLVNMPSEKRVSLFEKQLSKEEASLLNRELERAVASEKLNALKMWVRNNLDVKYREKKLTSAQKKVIENYIANEKRGNIRITKKIDDILKMGEKEQLDFLKSVMPEDKAIKAQKDIQARYASDIENKIDAELKALSDRKEAFGKEFKSLDEVDTFIEARSKLLADQKAGVALTDDEVAEFSRLGKELYGNVKYLEKGLLEDKEGMIKFGESLKAIQDYSESLKPISKWRAYVQNIGRVNMLASIKTPLLNIESNTITGFTEAIGRRLANWKFLGDVDKSVAKQYRQAAKELYKKTGLDLSRMITIEEPVTGAGKMLGEESGRTGNKVLDSYSDFIFNKTLTGPDVAFGNFAFTDSANIISSRLAKGDSKKATAIFKDATLLNPITPEGKVARLEAIASARRATYTDDSWSSKLALETRILLNNVPGLGDILMPFVKTVANVAELGADYAGVGFVKGGKKGIMLGISKMKGEAIDRAATIEVFNDLARAGIGMTAAYSIVSQIDVDDFMGAYDPARTGIDQLSNTAYNAIKVKTPFGEKWISLDYLGALAPSVVGMLYAKKYGEKEGSQGLGYLSGVGSQYIAQVPIFDPLNSFVAEAIKFNPNDSQALMKVFGDKIKRSLQDTVVSRMIPGMMNDFAKATDEYQRDTKQKTYNLGGVNWDQFAAKLPFLRKTLPVKYNSLGRLMYESSPVESFLFGARVKNDTSDAIVNEIYRLRDAGQKPNIRDLRFTTSDKVKELKDKIGDEKFYDVARKFGEDIAIAYKKEMDSPRYKNLSDEEKKKLLDSKMEDNYVKLMKKNRIKMR